MLASTAPLAARFRLEIGQRARNERRFRVYAPPILGRFQLCSLTSYLSKVMLAHHDGEIDRVVEHFDDAFDGSSNIINFEGAVPECLHVDLLVQ